MFCAVRTYVLTEKVYLILFRCFDSPVFFDSLTVEADIVREFNSRTT